MGVSKRRVIGILLKAGLALLLLSGIALFLYLRSPGFQERVRSEIVAALEGRFPVRVELESARVHLWGPRVGLRGLRIFDRLYPAEEPAIDLESAEVNLTVTSFFSPSASIDAVDLNRLRVRVVKDSNGRLNLWNMFRNQDDKPPKLTALIHLAIKELTINDGLIQFLDQSFHLESSKGGMEIEMRFAPGRPGYDGTLGLAGLDLGLAALNLSQVDATVQFTLLENSILFPGVEIKSRQLGGTASGAIDNLGELAYHFDTDFQTHPAEIASPPLDQLVERGDVRLAGAFTGRKSDFSFAGALSSPDLVVQGLPLRDLTAQLHADPQAVTVEQAKTRLHGGTVEARGVLQWHEPALSHFDVSGSGVGIAPLVRLLDPGPLRVAGSSSFRGRVQWPGLDFGGFRGDGTGSYRGRFSFSREGVEAVEPSPEFPFEGSARFSLNSTGATVSDGSLSTLGGALTIDGRVGYDAAYDFALSFEAPSGADTKSAVFATGLFDPAPIEEFSPRLPGPLRVETRLEGAGSDFHLAGSLSIEGLTARGVSLGDFGTAFDWNPARIELNDALLKGPLGEWAGSLSYLLGAGLDKPPGEPPEEFPRLGALLLSGSGAGLEDLLRVLDQDADVAGKGSAMLRVAEEPKGRFRVVGSVGVVDPVWEGIHLGSAEGRVDLDGSRLLIDDLRLGLDPAGAVSGRVSLDLESGRFDGQFSGTDVPVTALDSVSNGRLGGFEGVVDFSAKASGDREAPRLEATVRSESLRYRGQELRAVELKFDNQRPGGKEATFQVQAGIFGQRLAVDGSVGISEPYPVEASAELAEFPLAAALSQLPIDTDVALGGSATGTVTISGSLSQPDELSVEGVFSRLRLAMADYEIENRDNVTLILKDSRLRILPLTMVGKETELNVSGSVELDGQRSINLKTNGQANLLLLNTFLPGGATFGQLNLETVVSGTLESPKIVGHADLSKGFLRHPDVPTTIFDASGQFRFTADQIAVDQFSARTAYGTINAEGGIFLAGFKPVRWLINVSGEGLRLEYPQKVVSTLDVDVDWINNEDSQLLSGVVYVRSSEYSEQITLPELILRYGAGNALLSAPVSSQEVSLDIEVEGYRTLHIDNNLANVTASGDFRIRGTIANPVLLGSLTVDEGKLFLENNEYDVNRGTITFNDPRSTRPVFNFEAETEVRDYSVSVILQGPIDQLNATFRSDPPLAASSIVSLLAVGQTQEEIFGTGGGQGQAGSLAIYGAGALLSKSLGKRLEAQTSRLFGFEKLSIDPFLYGSERDPGARVTLGKSLGKNVSVTYSTDLGNEGQGQIVVIEVKLTDWLTAVGTGEQNGSVAIDFKLRKRF